MAFRDFLLLFAVCLVWGLNIVLTRWVVADVGVPPLFFAAVRFPADLKMLFIIAMLIGSLNFALLFMGLQQAEASAAAVTGQLGVPISTLMSMAFLGETIGWRRGLGIMLAFAGVVLIAVDPGSFGISVGLLYIVASAFIGSAGGILMSPACSKATSWSATSPAAGRSGSPACSRLSACPSSGTAPSTR